MSRGDGSDNSDVDLLVTLAPGTSALALGGLLLDAQELLGRRVGCRHRSELAPCAARARDGRGRAAVNPCPEADRVLLAHMRDCLAGSSSTPTPNAPASTLRVCAGRRDTQSADLGRIEPALSNEIKATEPRIPWRELAGFRNVIVHGYLGVAG